MKRYLNFNPDKLIKITNMYTTSFTEKKGKEKKERERNYNLAKDKEYQSRIYIASCAQIDLEP